MRTISVIHATMAAVPPVATALLALPEYGILHQIDEALLAGAERHGRITERCVERMRTLLELAADAGSEAVLTTCNAYSVVVMRTLRPDFPRLPIVVIDEPMIRQAVTAESIGVIATVRAGLTAQQEMLDEVLAVRDERPDFTFRLREDAFDALCNGRPHDHDRIVLDEIERLSDEVAVVVLAQASMSRCSHLIREPLRRRVLSSPDLAVDELRRVLAPTRAR